MLNSHSESMQRQESGQESGSLSARASSVDRPPTHLRLREMRQAVTPPLPQSLRDIKRAPPCFEVTHGGGQAAAAVPQRLESLPPLHLRAVDPAGGAVDTSGDGTASAGSSRPLRVGVLICSSGPYLPTYPVNVLEGLLTHLSVAAPGSVVLGFPDGPQGFLEGRSKELHLDEVQAYRNQSGWPILNWGSCSEGDLTLEACAGDICRAASVCSEEGLDSLVIIAGPRDLAWASVLAAAFAKEMHPTKVVGVPFSKNCAVYVPDFMPITLGFDSARRVISEIAGNIFTDAVSSKKYWHFIRTGEDALTMEVALQTRCPFTMLKAPEGQEEGARERSAEDTSLKGMVRRLEQVVAKRWAAGRYSGVVLLSDNLIQELPEMNKLRMELAEVLGGPDTTRKIPPSRQEVEQKLKQEDARELFKRLPRVVQMSLITRRDASGMPLLPGKLEIERVVGRFVEQNLRESQPEVEQHASPVFVPRFHCIELMALAPLPSNFDCAFGMALGHAAGALVCERQTFYVASCRNMHQPVKDWELCAVPFSMLWPSSDGSSVAQPWATSQRLRLMAARQTMLDAYKHFQEAWVDSNIFKSPGPMQYGDVGDVGPMSDRPLTLLGEYLTPDELKQIIQPVTSLPPPVLIKVSASQTVVRDQRVPDNLSTLEQRRLEYTPEMPMYLRGAISATSEDISPQASNSSEGLARSFPLTYGQTSSLRIERVMERRTSRGQNEMSGEKNVFFCNPRRFGVVFGSGQAPGYHTVVAGLFDYLSGLTPPADVIGFAGGLQGLVKNVALPINKRMVDSYRNLGGQDMLCVFGEPGSLAFKDRLMAATSTIRNQKLDALIVVGNMESQVDAAFLAEACAAENLETCIIGVPISVECDFPFVQQSIGHDTVCHTLSAYLGQLGCLARTSNSAWVFVRIIGGAWSHIAVELTMQAHPNIVLMSGSQLHGQCLPGIINSICDLIIQRHNAGQHYGVVLLPLGFVQDITEMRLLLMEIAVILAHDQTEVSWDSIPKIYAKLEPRSAALFDLMPRDVQYEICFGAREAGRSSEVHLPSISTDRLILRFVELEMKRRQQVGLLSEDFFRGFCYPMLHHARSSIPSNLDCDLAYTLGWGAARLACLGKTGVLIKASNLQDPVQDWKVGAVPLTNLLRALLDEDSQEYIIRPAFLQLLRQRGILRPFSRLPPLSERVALYIGPMQFYGKIAADPVIRTTWFMENFPIQDPETALVEISALCFEMQSCVANAKAESTLYAVNAILANAVNLLDCYKGLDASSRRSAQSLADIPMQLMPQVWRTRQKEEAHESSRSRVSSDKAKDGPISPDALLAASARADIHQNIGSPRNHARLSMAPAMSMPPHKSSKGEPG